MSIPCIARKLPTCMLFLLLSCARLLALPYSYNLLSIKDGLPPDVLCVCAEKNGYLWIGTSVGLARFDGKDVKTLFSGTGRNALTGTAILNINQDETGQLWVLSSKGAARYREDRDDFVMPGESPGIGSPVMAFTSFLSADGILFGGKGKIFRYERETDSFSVYAGTEDALQEYSFHTLCEMQNGSLLCLDPWNGVLLLDRRTKTFSQPPFPTGKDNSCIFVDSKNRVWISPYNRGIQCFNAKGELLRAYNTNNSALSNNIILSVIERDGLLWMGTDGGGIDILDPETGTVSVLRHRVGERGSLPGNSILTLQQDAAGNVWAGRVKGGLILIRDFPIKTYTGIPIGETGLSYDAVLCLHQDPDTQDIWIGTDGGGINKFNPATERFTRYASTDGMKVADIADCSRTELLLSVFSGGIYRFNKQSGQIRALSVSGKSLEYQMRYSGIAVNFMEEASGAVVLLTHPLYRLDPSTEQLSEIQTHEKTGGSLKRVINANGLNLFYSTSCVFRLDPATDSLEVLYRCGPDTSLTCVSKGKDQQLWLATNQGLASLAPYRRALVWHESDYFNHIRSVAADGSNVWLGTDSYLTLWMDEKQRFCIYGELEGVLPNEYQAKATLVAKDGSVYLGGMNGLTRIGKSLQTETGSFPEIVLADLFMDRQRVTSTPGDGKVKMRWNNRDLSLRIFARDRNILKARVYSFKVTGPKHNDIFKSPSPELVLNNLSPGRHTIDAACTTDDGRQTDWKKILSVIVMPPWYQSRWFTAAWVMLLLLSAGLSAFLFIRKKEKQMRLEMEAYKRRTEEEQLLLRLDNLIMQHLHDKGLDIPFLCTELCMSRTKLYNKIKQLTGKNIKEYITRIRMERAKELIGTSGQTFTEIAEQTGYSTLRYFSTAFRQYTGLTPSQYRGRSGTE